MLFYLLFIIIFFFSKGELIQNPLRLKSIPSMNVFFLYIFLPKFCFFSSYFRFRASQLHFPIFFNIFFTFTLSFFPFFFFVTYISRFRYALVCKNKKKTYFVVCIFWVFCVCGERLFPCIDFWEFYATRNVFFVYLYLLFVLLCMFSFIVLMPWNYYTQIIILARPISNM